MVTCTFGCIELMSTPPMVSFTCIADCVAQACADVRFFVDQVVNCAISQIGTCSDFDCIMRECGTEIAACLTAPRCPPGM